MCAYAAQEFATIAVSHNLKRCHSILLAHAYTQFCEGSAIDPVVKSEAPHLRQLTVDVLVGMKAESMHVSQLAHYCH